MKNGKKWSIFQTINSINQQLVDVKRQFNNRIEQLIE